jgi:cytidyltransferase-like protein
MIICIYAGSFDPFHKGHQEVVHTILNQNIADMIYVVAGDPSHKNRIDLKHQINIIKTYFDDNNVMVSDKTSEELLKECKNTNDTVISVLGSDQYLSLLHENKVPKLKIKYWYVVPRDGDNLVKTNKIQDINFMLLNHAFEYQNISSNLIKKNIISNTDNSKFLNNGSLEYIKRHKLYSKDELLKKELEKLISTKIHTLNKIKEGLSDADVYKINNDLIAKLIYNKNEYENEIIGYNLLKEIIHNNINIRHKSYDDSYGIIVLPYITNIFDDIVHDDPNQVGRLIGSKLGYLHFSNQVKITNIEVLMQHPKMLKTKKFIGIDHKLLNNYINNPGDYCVTHGDAGINNIIINANHEVIFIDLCKVSNSITDDGFIGIPGYELYQLISSVKKLNLHKETEEEFINGIMIGYLDKTHNTMTKESHELFSHYWLNVRN